MNRSGMQASPALLENERLLIELDAGGALRAVIDKRTGRNYIEAPPEFGRPLFRIILTEIDDRGHVLPGEIELDALLASSCSLEKDASGTRLTVHYRLIDGLPIDVICNVTLDEDAPLSRWTISVNNRSELAVKEIVYPVVHAVYQLGDSKYDDRIVIPRHDGHLVGNPDVHPWESDGIPRDNQRYLYPGEGKNLPAGMSAQLSAYYDADGGLYMAVHDESGQPKRLGPVVIAPNDVKQFDCSPAHICSELPGQSIDIAYETVIGCFDGDWQAAADIYKRWAVTTAWCARTVAERDDIPEWIKKGAFFFSFRLRHQEDGEQFLERVPAYVDKWQRALGIPFVAMMGGWEQIGEWTGPEYFPPYGGDERFARMCRRLKENGVKPFPFGLSGLKLAIRKKIPRNGAQPELAVDYDARRRFREAYSPHAATRPGGEAILDSAVNSWDGLHAYACPATEQARDQLHGASMRLIADYGVQVSQADQLFNGATTECYNTEHGHPPGRGVWQIEAIRGIYRDLRRDGKALDDAFILSQEWQSELLLQELDIFHCRNYDQPRGIAGIPLFAYLYHEYQLSYGGDWSSFLSDNMNGVYYHAANFVNGNMPAGSPQTMMKMSRNVEPEEADPRILRMAANACALFVQYTNYLLLGQMLNTPPLQVPGETIRFVGVNFGYAKGDMTVPAVLHRAWRAPDGKVAYALANVTDRAQRFLLPVAKVEHDTPVRLVLHVSGAERRVVAEQAELPRLADITLEPGDVAMLEIEPVAGATG